MIPTKILIADDDPLMRTLIAVSVSGMEGTDTVEAADGAEALAVFERESFDLVITDWDMPGTSGLDVLKTIRAKGSEVPVIMVTATAEKEMVVEALVAGASDYIIKPFESAVLWGKLKKFCRRLACDATP